MVGGGEEKQTETEREGRREKQRKRDFSKYRRRPQHVNALI